MRREKMPKKRVLLHICCAPDATYPSEFLKQDYEVVGYYYNPNMDTIEEDLKRFKETEKVAEIFNFKLLSDTGDISSREEWRKAIKGLEDLPEHGTRCFKCMEFRMKKTAEKAKQGDFDYFATTLTVSPHKNAFLINSIGQYISKSMNIEYLESNFKKKNGFKKTLEYSKQFNLYRQNYCGCEFSKRSC